MAAATTTDTALLSVSIVAGPAAGSVAKKFRAAEVFSPSANSTPQEIVDRVKAIAARTEARHLVLQCDSERPAMAYASLFADTSTSLANVSRLTSVAFAIESTTLLDALLDRKTAAISPCFLAEQLEFVTEIFVDGPIKDPAFDLARTVVTALNPEVQILSEVTPWEGRGNVNFDFAKALNAARWRKLVEDEDAAVTAEKRVSAFGYKARRPFHPKRFWDLLEKGLPGVFRAKGFFWIATRMDEVGGLNLAGSELQCACAGQWWAARDFKTREAEMPDRTRNLWQEPFGDRRQSFAVMALGVERATLERSLDSCLLTDDEMAQGPDWNNLPDPFPSWHHQPHDHSHGHEHGEDCDHDHDHESHEHHCCQD